MINVNNVSKSFNGKHILQNFNLSVNSGEIHILLGASGSGKTTLLRMIAGLEEIHEGQINIDGQDIKSFSQREKSTLMAYITQEGGLFPHLTAKDNILLPMKVRKIAKSDSKKRLEELAHLVDLELTQLDHFPHQLSGGQCQRVALMRGLMLNPKVILLDEPLSALDPIIRAALQKDLRKIFKNLKKTVLLVTHDIQEASYMGDCITLLNEGRIVQSGPFRDLFYQASDPFVHEFVRAQIPLEVEWKS